MKLYLAQHGEACPKEVDPERPLTDQGREDIERLTAFLGRAGIQVTRVIDSGKLRAAQTADLLAVGRARDPRQPAAQRRPRGDRLATGERRQGYAGGRPSAVHGQAGFTAGCRRSGQAGRGLSAG